MMCGSHLVGLIPLVLLAHSAKPIFDGRLHPNPEQITAEEETLLRNRVLPAARVHWRKEAKLAECTPGFQSGAVDVAEGTFTRAGAEQRAILYNFCTLGHDRVLEGIAVVEDGRLMAHVAFQGGDAHAISALTDINGNGIAEILLASGGTNQGITWGDVRIVELGGAQVHKLGRVATLDDNCGTGADACKMMAYRVWVKPGPAPVVLRDTFAGSKMTWRRRVAKEPLKPDEDGIVYALLP
jgi:hypothetical protein